MSAEHFMMEAHIPARSLQQRMDALSRANAIRTFRKDLKLEVKTGRRSVIDILGDSPDELSTMKVFDLMLAAPKLGRVKINRILNQCRISPSKTIGGLSERQRKEIISYLCRR